MSILGLFRTLLYYLCYSFHCQLVAIGEWWSRSKAIVYISKEDLEKCGTEHALLIMNHAYETDWLFGWFFCEKVGVLGNCKAYAKKAISYVPTIGWSWKFAEFVFLERSFDKDKEIIKEQLNEIFDYPDPVWLLLNAEGTRFTKSKHEASVKFAQERGMAVLNHHLIPRSKGFTASLSVLKKKCAAIMDVQLAFKEDDVNKPTIVNLLRGKSVTGHLYLRRISMSEVPEDEEEAAKWLQELYVRKDKLQTSFHETGDFFKNSGIKPIEPIVFPNRKSSLINWVAWMFVALLPILFFLINELMSGQIFHVIIGFGILFACKSCNTFINLIILILFQFAVYTLLNYAIGSTKISKASSYGKKNT
jgi:lysophosphatidic acid acyltransferase/lysophosphatidylinositol acyltransferase